MTQLAQQFSQSSGVTVNHVPQPQYLEKLETAAAGQTLPEMTVIRATDIALMAARNIIKPMRADMLTAVGGEAIAAQFPEQVWNIGAYQDQRYAVPLDVHPIVLYYNKDLVAAAGVTIPEDRPMTRDEFEAAVDALNKDGVAGIAIGTLGNGQMLFEMLLHQFGGQLANEDGTEATYNSGQGVEALTYLRDLKQKTSPTTSGQGSPEVTQFQQGKAAMVMHGPWHIGNLSKLPFTGYAQAPQIGDAFAVWGNSHQLAVATDDPAKQAAAGCWIGWLSQNSAQWATAGQVPAREDARMTLPDAAAPVRAFASEIEAVIMPPNIAGFSSAVGGTEGFGRAVDPVLLGDQSDVQAALDAAAQRSTQLLQQNAQTYGQ
jgi:multiple sugar transport system substrate-binding protein